MAVADAVPFQTAPTTESEPPPPQWCGEDNDSTILLIVTSVCNYISYFSKRAASTVLQCFCTVRESCSRADALPNATSQAMMCSQTTLLLSPFRHCPVYLLTGSGAGDNSISGLCRGNWQLLAHYLTQQRAGLLASVLLCSSSFCMPWRSKSLLFGGDRCPESGNTNTIHIPAKIGIFYFSATWQTRRVLLHILPGS